VNGLYRTNWLRRGVGVLLCGLPMFLLIGSFVRAVLAGDQPRTAATLVMLMSLAVAMLNFSLTFRPALYHWRHGSLQGFRQVSGMPLIGSLIVVVGTVLGYGSLLCAVLGWIAVALDTRGSAWLLISTWKDASFWDQLRVRQP
jgi:hypothetical protein